MERKTRKPKRLYVDLFSRVFFGFLGLLIFYLFYGSVVFFDFFESLDVFGFMGLLIFWNFRSVFLNLIVVRFVGP